MANLVDSFTLQTIPQILLAAVLGGLLGLEREYLHRAAGLRTNILVCVGCTLFTIVSKTGFEEFIGPTSYDPSRIASAILIGIGFIGAGTIMKHEDRIIGLTTAATLWLVAAIGVTIGLKFYLLAFFTTIFALFLLVVLRFFEEKIRTKK